MGRLYLQWLGPPMVTHARRVLLFQQFCRLARSTAIRLETVGRNILPTIRVHATRHRNRAKCLDTDPLQLPIDTPRPIPSALVISVVPRPCSLSTPTLATSIEARRPLPASIGPLLETGGHARTAPQGQKNILRTREQTEDMTFRSPSKQFRRPLIIHASSEFIRKCRLDQLRIRSAAVTWRKMR